MITAAGSLPFPEPHELQAPSRGLRRGDLVGNRFRVLRVVGVGGMGSVYEARDNARHRYAIKVLHPHLLVHPVLPRRFLREAEAARALATPHAVKVECVGTLPDGCPYIVMEYLDGVNLSTYLAQQGGRLSIESALRLADQVAAGLQEAHARGIVHRDLKPENIFVLGTPAEAQAKVVDFGISKFAEGEGRAKLTQTGVTIGTPQYMPIEQLRAAQDLDGRVDVYALGVILYEVLAGGRPYDGFSYEEVILKIATTQAAGLGTYRPDLPSGLVRVIDQAMARDREERPGSMAELRSSLEPYWRRGVAPRSTPPSSGDSAQPSASSQPPETPASASSQPPAPGPRSPGFSPSMPQVGHSETAPGAIHTAQDSMPPETSRGSPYGALVLALMVIVFAAVVGLVGVLVAAGAWNYLGR